MMWLPGYMYTYVVVSLMLAVDDSVSVFFYEKAVSLNCLVTIP
jgi:hypothetical protein